jgi:hypothetical protein
MNEVRQGEVRADEPALAILDLAREKYGLDLIRIGGRRYSAGSTTA